MAQPALVRVELARGADLDVVGIDQDDRVRVSGWLTLIAATTTFPPSLPLMRKPDIGLAARSEVAEIGVGRGRRGRRAAAAIGGTAARSGFSLLANWFMSAEAVAWIMPTPRPYCATAPDSVRSVCTSTLEPAADGSSRNVAFGLRRAAALGVGALRASRARE